MSKISLSDIKPQKYVITREVTQEECHWLEGGIQPGEYWYKCLGPDYGATNTNNGISLTRDPDGDYPGYEVPYTAIEEVNE